MLDIEILRLDWFRGSVYQAPRSDTACCRERSAILLCEGLFSLHGLGRRAAFSRFFLPEETRGLRRWLRGCLGKVAFGYTAGGTIPPLGQQERRGLEHRCHGRAPKSCLQVRTFAVTLLLEDKEWCLHRTREQHCPKHSEVFGFHTCCRVKSWGGRSHSLPAVCPPGASCDTLRIGSVQQQGSW